MNLSDLESALGLVFEDKSLLQRALTHRSYLNENPNLPWLDNERLEFLGDSILGFVTAEYLYHHFPEMHEGDLTSVRAALVRGETLAQYAQAMDLGSHLFISHGEEAAGGRTRRALLAGTFEAIIGAIYLDRGLEAARAFIVRAIETKTDTIVRERLDRNAKSLLQELSQARLKVTPAYRTVSSHGPEHAREFTVQVLLGPRVYGTGRGRNKQGAEQLAAREALETLEHEMQEDLARQVAEKAEPPATAPEEPTGESALATPSVESVAKASPPPTEGPAEIPPHPPEPIVAPSEEPLAEPSSSPAEPIASASAESDRPTALPEGANEGPTGTGPVASEAPPPTFPEPIDGPLGDNDPRLPDPSSHPPTRDGSQSPEPPRTRAGDEPTSFPEQ